jgi:hypothetical protein
MTMIRATSGHEIRRARAGDAEPFAALFQLG